MSSLSIEEKLRYFGIFILILGVILGWTANTVAFKYQASNTESPFSVYDGQIIPMPKDRINEDSIHVFSDKIVIDIANAQWSKFTPTKSMLPLLDKGANGIQIVPESPDQIELGDVVSYESNYYEGIIIHRVVKIDQDEEGWYCIVKGDSNDYRDPGKIRFNQIKRVLVGVIY